MDDLDEVPREDLPGFADYVRAGERGPGRDGWDVAHDASRATLSGVLKIIAGVLVAMWPSSR